ncbi:MAG: T9SS type A sorting domain-containing protein, partial [Bacteroidetes bacterium]|nr:T9SS type A sorting domain-containing protein [Bacteroidota bacterium]
TATNGSVIIGRNGSVASTGAFVKARNITVQNGANVPTRITSPAVVTLPTMQYNTSSVAGLSNLNIGNNATRTVNGNYRNVTIGSNSNVTLTGSFFGTITVGARSTVTFTQATVSVTGITLQQGTNAAPTTMNFTQPAVVMSSGNVSVASHAVVNPNNEKVIFFIGTSSNTALNFNVASGGNTTVNASMYIPNGTLAVGGDNSNTTNMTGKFIAGQVTSTGRNVIWNSFDCSAAPVVSVLSNTNTGSIENTDAVKSNDGTFDVIVAPNPTQSYFTLTVVSSSNEAAEIRIFDMAGRQIEQRRNGVGEQVRFGGNYVQGMYIVQVLQGTNQKLIKVVKN